MFQHPFALFLPWEYDVHSVLLTADPEDGPSKRRAWAAGELPRLAVTVGRSACLRAPYPGSGRFLVGDSVVTLPSGGRPMAGALGTVTTLAKGESPTTTVR